MPAQTEYHPSERTDVRNGCDNSVRADARSEEVAALMWTRTIGWIACYHMEWTEKILYSTDALHYVHPLNCTCVQ